jgi:hypothetical protein
MRVIRVLGVLKGITGFWNVNPDFAHFEGIWGFGGQGLYSQEYSQTELKKSNDQKYIKHYPHHTLYPISYQGGAIIGVFMI